MEIRRLVQIVEAASRPPSVLYHGTNLLSACHVLNDGMIRADDPGDHDGQAVVCTSSKQTMARNFAVEFVRHNSRLDVGAVFVLDARKIIKAGIQMEPFESETASIPEYEWRVRGSLPLDRFLIGTRLVGRTAMLRSERKMWQLWDDEGSPFGTFASFMDLVERLRGA